MDKRILSFIIPSLNEEESILAVINSIRTNVNKRYSYEIVVVDNGSSDQTVCIAKEFCSVHIVKNVTISTLRNFGVKKSTGKILVFLDADVYITSNWVARLPVTIDLLDNNPMIVTGSRCRVSNQPSSLEKLWFMPLAEEKGNYINSGHLVMTRTLFGLVGGFSEELAVSEDYDFSSRAKKIGSIIYNDPKLEAVHTGYPKNLYDFFKREMWHGRDGFRTVRDIITSKVSIATIIFLLLHLLLILQMSGSIFVETIVIIFTIASLCFFSSLMKYKKTFTRVVPNSLIYYVYYFARMIALVLSIISRCYRGCQPLLGKIHKM